MRRTAEQVAKLGASPRSLARGFAALRILFGVIWLSNAVAKIVGVGAVDWGPFSFTLINRSGARGILVDAVDKTRIAPLRTLYTDLVLANWELFQWLLTGAELAIGLGLLFGVASRLAALGGLLLITPIWLMLWDNRLYLWEYPLDLVPLLLLAIVPAGRVWGLDGKLAARFSGRWPF
ncbi:MAG TPA: hypothetical protein VFQ77_07055 [Pseudonocardiaceae bacterium]|jgi:thiosulfate dehydrogenase [quinone] large subunit|nr:hypothetical protein [Pseudonocardiaceae bacterium]